MLSRKEAVKEIKKILSNDNPPDLPGKGCVHWGLMEIRLIVDAIYEGKPQSKEEEI